MSSFEMMLKIARREYSAHVRTRSFIIGTICTPLLLLAIVLLPSQRSGAPAPIVLSIIDQSGELLTPLVAAFEEHSNLGGVMILPAPEMTSSRPADFRARLDEMEQRVAGGQANAVLVLPADAIAGGAFELRVPKGAPLPHGTADAVLACLERALVQRRLVGVELDLETRRLINYPPRVRVTESKLGPKNVTGIGAMLRTLTFVILLYLTTFGMSHALLSSVIEEKTSKIVELLLSAISPTELMGGKIIGIGGVGLTLVGIWSTAGWIFGAASGRLPSMPVSLLASFLLYFVLGFLLYAAILAGIGATVSSIKEAHHLVTPITMVMMLPVLLWWQVTSRPDSQLSIALSWFPLTTPIAMMNRIATPNPPAAFEIIGTALVMLASIALAIRLAARLFRVGLLIQGSPPGIRMLFRWMRA